MDEAELDKEFEKARKKGLFDRMKGSIGDVKDTISIVKSQFSLATQMAEIPKKIQKAFKDLEELSKNPTEENQRKIEEIFKSTEEMFNTIKSIPQADNLMSNVEKEYFIHKQQYYDSLKLLEGKDITEVADVCEHEFELESPKRKGYSNRIFLLSIPHMNLGIQRNSISREYEIQDVNTKKVWFSGTLEATVEKANELEGGGEIRVRCGEACPNKKA